MKQTYTIISKNGINAEELDLILEMYPSVQVHSVKRVLPKLDKDTRKWLIKTLESWQSTYDNEGDDSGWEELAGVIKKLKNRNCNLEDYETVLFHLWQKFDDGEE